MTDIKETIELSLKATGFDKGAADVKALGASEKDAATQAELLARAQTTVEKSLTRVQSRMVAYTASLDPAEKALKKLEQGEAIVAAARSRGLTVTDAMTRSVELARERFERLKVESTGAAGALALTRNESLALTYTINDVVASLSSGASPMTIMMQQGGQLTQAFGGVRGTFEKLLPMLARFAPLAAGAGAAALAFKEVLGSYEELKKINEGASSVGVSTDLFQIWINHATRLRLTVEDAEKAIVHAGQTLAGQVDNFSALSLDGGKSRVAERANNLSDVIGRDVPSKGLAADAATLDEMHRAALQLVQDYLAAVNELDGHGRLLDANQARLEAITAATEVWGDAGRKIAEGLRDGTITADEFLSKSEDAGRVWSDEILEAQTRVSQEITTANEHLSRALNPATEELQKLTINVLHAWADVVDKIASAVEWAHKWLTIMRAASGVVSGIVRDGGLAPASGPATSGRMGRIVSLEGDTSEGHSMRDLTGDSAPLPPSRPEGLGKAAPAARGGRASRAGAKEAHDELKGYLESLEKTIALLDAEAGAQGKSNAGKERAIDLAKAEEIAKERGRPLTQAEIDAVTALADRHAALRARIDETREAQRAANEQSRFFAETAFGAIDRLTTGTAKLTDVVQSLARSLAQAALKAALLGEGPLAGLIGAQGQNGAIGRLFGQLSSGLSGGFAGYFAEGGAIPSGQWGIVGERGPEMVYAGVSGANVFPAVSAASLARASGTVNNSKVVHSPINVTIQTPNAQSFARSEGQIAATLARAVAMGQRGL
ncbi:phage tail length tape measure family protein [Methylocystis sp. ATCC 49242]|uniref:phage tail length tape measure family protein n=1 Tax=Methylocystis sp. ATCC 49242 TaxID=622637 RepID=UPI0001F88854|nr:phage tail length tape measure family protein [Methylocystis sp. ATCC 49242]